jgi:hypothetical protein
VDNVLVRQNVLQRLLDVGSVELLTRDRRFQRVVFEGINSPDAVAEKIRELARQLSDNASVLEAKVAGRTDGG